MINLNRKQLVVLTTLAGCNFLSALVFSLQAPFYPAEAEKKGASTTFAGLVLGIYELAGFLACPLVSSKILPRLSSYRCFHLGILTTGTTIILFGFLNRVNNATAFILLSLVLRILEAFGSASSFVSSYGFLNVVFPDAMGTAFAVMETMFAVGMAAGPPVGEALYELGLLTMGTETWGYTSPFLTMGIIFYISTIVTSRSLGSVKDLVDVPTESKTEEDDKGMPNGGIKKPETFSAFLRVPSICIFYMAVMAVALCLGFITCTLEPHLRQFHLSPLQVGGVFLIFGGVYACTAWIWGFIGDRIAKPIVPTLIGCVLTIFAFTFMGPSVIIPLEPSVALTGVSLAACGLGSGAIYVSVFLLMTNEAKRQGLAESASNGAISALWLSGMHLGSFAGPILGGALYEKFGFGGETMFAVVLIVVILILLLFVFGTNSNSGSTFLEPVTPCPNIAKMEKMPLLNSEHNKTYA